MRGILIDPFTRTVSEIETSGKLAEIYELLGVELITAVTVGEDQSLFLDDEGLLVPKADQEYWNWKGSNQPYAGRGLILGLDEDGDNIDATMGSLEVAMLVTFLDKEGLDPESYLGFGIFTWRNMSKLNKCAADGMYRMEGSSVWIFADDADIWIIKGEQGLSISVWSKDTKRDPIDAINLDWKTIKGGD